MSGWQNEPFAVQVKNGETKVFCTCGLSKNGPYCDGSHKDTEFSPNVVTFDKDKTVFICGCLKTGNAPFCDGSHSSQ